MAFFKWVFRGYGCLEIEAALQHPVTNDDIRQRNAKSTTQKLFFPYCTLLCSSQLSEEMRPHCRVLQCIAVIGRVLLCVAVCCSVLQCVAVCCSVLQCVAVCCSVLQCVAVCCSVLPCAAVCCSVLQCVDTYIYPYTTYIFLQRVAV